MQNPDMSQALPIPISALSFSDLDWYPRGSDGAPDFRIMAKDEAGQTKATHMSHIYSLHSYRCHTAMHLLNHDRFEDSEK